MMEKLDFHGNLTLRDFWLNWFGLQGRELGSTIPHKFGINPKGDIESHRMFTNNPEVYLQFIDWCIENKQACWITSQPMRTYNTPFGLEKLFFDFDYHLEKNENMTPAKRRKVDDMTLKFIEQLDYEEPLIIKTRKGNHVYIFLRRIYECDEKNVEFAKLLLGVLCLSRLKIKTCLTATRSNPSILYQEISEEDRIKWKYLDFNPLGDIMRMARVPLTPHEKTGTICQILDRNLKPTKVRSIDWYRGYGLTENEIEKAVDIIKYFYRKKITKEWQQVENGIKSLVPHNGKFKGQMRPCFTERLKIGEMKHQQRLALRNEMWWSGYKTKEAMLEICKQFKDYDETKSMTQINDFFSHEGWKFPPYKCSTIKAYGWCLKSECPLYKE